MKLLKLTRGKLAMVDDADFERLFECKWQARFNRGTWYAYRCVYVKRVATRKHGYYNLSLQEAVMGNRPGWFIDHRDKNPLNNTRQNLRFATRVQNNANRGPMGALRLKGVTRRKNKYRARICADGKSTNLGTFWTAIEAARAYDKAALALWGEFASLNNV